MNMMRKNNNNRGGGGNKHRSGGGGGGGRRYSNNNRSGGSSGGHNDGQNLTRQKHHATQMREKFANMARDVQNNGDRVDVEYYLQHVDHYTRVLAEIAVIEAERFAHQREQHQTTPVGENAEAQPAQQNDHAGAEQTHNEQQNATPQELQQPYGSTQPRMTRQPRHVQHTVAPETVEHAASGATNNDESNGDIPLPGLPVL